MLTLMVYGGSLSAADLDDRLKNKARLEGGNSEAELRKRALCADWRAG